jgi:FAD binding domain
VPVLERAPEAENGGNSRFTADAIRFAYDGIEDLKAVMPDLSQDEIDRTDFGTYTEDQFFDDMFRVTRYRCDPELIELLVRRSKEAVLWMRDKGVRFVPSTAVRPLSGTAASRSGAASRWRPPAAEPLHLVRRARPSSCSTARR